MFTDPAIAYEAYAQEFLRARDASTIGSSVVEQWARTLPMGAEVIELGCGAGYPVTRTLHAAGLKLWAIDSSVSLVAEVNRRFPSVPVQCEKVQGSNFFNRTYHEAVAVVCHSLGRARYESCLNAVGLRIVGTFADKGGNNYFDAERTS